MMGGRPVAPLTRSQRVSNRQFKAARPRIFLTPQLNSVIQWPQIPVSEGSMSVNIIFVAMVLVVSLLHAASAGAQGNADAGKKLWAGNTLFCENCHGPEG